LLESDEEGRRSRGPKRHQKKHASALAQKKTSASIEPPVTVRDLSEAIGVKANELMRKFMQITNQLVTINAVLEDEAAIELAMEFGVELTIAEGALLASGVAKVFHPGAPLEEIARFIREAAAKVRAAA
jgi:translation initiation factor IF-2